MDKVRVCLVGAGRVARVHGYNLKTCIPNSELVAIVDKKEELAEDLASELSVSKVFKNHQQALDWGKFDAVVITTPTFTHCQIVVDAASSKKHIFCEKPIALTLKEANLMIDECYKNEVKFQIGFMRRFDPEFILAKKRIEEGAIGEIILIKSTGRGPGLPPEWALDIEKSGGMLAEVSSHDFDSLMWFAKSELKSVEAIAKNYKHPEIRERYPSFYDTAIVIGTFKNGKMGIVDMSCPANYGYDARMEILGSEGVMFVGNIKSGNISYCTRKKGVIFPHYFSWRERFKQAYIDELQHFINCIVENKNPEVNGEDGKRSLAVVAAANLSIRTGKKIEVIY